MSRVLIVLAAVCALTYGFHVRMPAPRMDGRIVGGEDTDISELPYQLSLLKSGMHTCGASIVSPDWAITAGHCVRSSNASSVSLRAGSSIRNSGGSVHQASAIIVHPNYDFYTLDFDYALIKVDTPFSYNNNVQPIELAETEPAGGDEAITSGWGTVSAEGVSAPRQLQSVKLPIVDRDTCNDRYGSDEITERMICAGVLDVGGKDACQGDSGGPIASKGKLVGVVSWGNGCAHPDFPGIFSNVADQRPWIRQLTGV